MLRPSLCVAASLLFSSLGFAQHTTTTSTPAPSPAPSVHMSAPAPAPSPAPSISHAAPSLPPPASHSSFHSDRAPLAAHVSSDDSMSRKKPGSEHASKPADPELRKHVCLHGPCEPNPPSVCVNGNCTCPDGKAAGSAGCVTTAALAPTEQRPCALGAVWNGSSCTGAMQCPAGQVRRGAVCQSDCAAINAQAQGMIQQVREDRRNRDDSCAQGPAGTACSQASATYDSELAQYRSLWNALATECRASLQQPDSI